LTRISAHGERKLKLRRASLAKETQREARQAQEQVQSPTSINTEGSPANRSTMDTNQTQGNGVAAPDTHDTNGNASAPADGARDDPNQVANNTNATNGVADGVANGDRDGETDDAA
jgi:hypothetical protein